MMPVMQYRTPQHGGPEPNYHPFPTMSLEVSGPHRLAKQRYQENADHYSNE
jgi:hypothetical protein